MARTPGFSAPAHAAMLVLYRCGVDSYNAEVKTAGQAFSAQFQQCMADMQERRREYVSLQRAVCLGSVSRLHACGVLCLRAGSYDVPLRWRHSWPPWMHNSRRWVVP